jgi:hypothetical protein
LFHKEGDENMKSRFLFIIFLSVLFLVSCGSNSNSTEITWQGTWMSTKNYDERGTFTFNLQIEYEEISGTITIPGMGISDLQIEGEASKDYDGYSNRVTDIEISDIDGRMTFEAIVYTHDIDSDTRLDGIYVDNANEDQGRWYCKDDSRKDFSGISSFPLDSSIVHPRGLCFDGNHLWLSDVDDPATIYKIDETNGMIIDSFDVSGTIDNPQGLAWDGSSIYCIGSGTLYKLDTLCSIQSSVSCMSAGGADITYASGYIWCGDPLRDRLQKIDPSNGIVENTYNSPTTWPAGFAFDGANLWLSDGYNSYYWPAIFKIDLSGNLIDRYNSPCFYPWGLAFGDSYLYCIDFENKRIFKVGF